MLEEVLEVLLLRLLVPVLYRLEKPAWREEIHSHMVKFQGLEQHRQVDNHHCRSHHGCKRSFLADVTPSLHNRPKHQCSQSRPGDKM